MPYSFLNSSNSLPSRTRAIIDLTSKGCLRSVGATVRSSFTSNEIVQYYCHYLGGVLVIFCTRMMFLLDVYFTIFTMLVLVEHKTNS